MASGKSIAVLAASFFLPASAAWSDGGDPNLIHACVHKSSAHVRIVGAGESCKQNESPLHWPAQAAASSGAVRGVQLFERDGAFTVPPGVTSVVIEAWGGGGGAGLRAGASSGGGGGGGYVRTVVAVSPGQIVPVTVGQGGAATCGIDGGAGGDTAFGALLTAGGGQGGTVAGQGGAGGSADAGGISVPGEAGFTPGVGGPAVGGIGRAAQGSFAPPRNPAGVATAPGKGGLSILAPGTQNCAIFEQQFSAGQSGQLIVQW